MEARKPYTPPVLLDYGSVNELTQQGGSMRGGVPGTPEGTGYSA